MVNWKDWDWTLIIVVVIVAIVLTSMIIADRQLKNENTQLKAGMVSMDSLLTIYQTQLTACRAERDTLGYAVVSMFNAMEVIP